MREMKHDSRDTNYMQAALKLARRGIGSVEPNPAVGCIITKANQIAGKGWHKKFGGPHAEINAIEDCKTLGINPEAATMYVTLEPCCHHGKTGPCTDAIIAAGLAKVVVAAIDPSEHAAGRGIEQLRNAGIDVHVGLCEDQAKLLNAPFFKFAATGRSWVIVKWAQSIDGKLAYADKADARWISGQRSRKDAHQLRRRVQAILVGINTVLADDPLLTARPGRTEQPTRIVLDGRLRIPLDSKLLATTKKAPVLILTSQQAAQAKPEVVQKITEKGAELLTWPDTDRSNLYFLLDQLSERRIAQLLVEGGPRVIASFLKEKLADEIRVYISSRILGRSGSVDISEPMSELTEAVDLHNVDIENFGDDICLSAIIAGSV